MGLKRPPIYSEILAKNHGRVGAATAEWCVKMACWLTDLKTWAVNIVHGEKDAQAAIEQLVTSLSDIEYYLPISKLKKKEEHCCVLSQGEMNHAR